MATGILSSSQVTAGRWHACARRAPARVRANACGPSCSTVNNRAQITTEAVCRTPVDVSRRTLALSLISAPALFLVPSPSVAQESWTVFEDGVDQFAISLPSSWQAGQGAVDGGMMGSRRALAYFPSFETAADTNVTIVITNVGADYVGMGSMGSAYAFGQNMVNSMDQSVLLRAKRVPTVEQPIQVAKLLDAVERGEFYEIEYSVQRLPDQPKRHLMSLLTLGYNGRYNRLYTVTAQCKDEDWEQNAPVFEEIFRKFKAPAFISRWARTAAAV